MTHTVAVLVFLLALFSATVLLLKLGLRAGRRRLGQGAEPTCQLSFS